MSVKVEVTVRVWEKRVRMISFRSTRRRRRRRGWKGKDSSLTVTTGKLQVLQVGFSVVAAEGETAQKGSDRWASFLDARRAREVGNLAHLKHLVLPLLDRPKEGRGEERMGQLRNKRGKKRDSVSERATHRSQGERSWFDDGLDGLSDLQEENRKEI